MDIISQPEDLTLGETLQSLLEDRSRIGYDTFYILVAYVRESGVLRLQPAIEDFKSRGGRVMAVVGVGQKNTSEQGLSLLLQLCDEVVVHHNESRTQTFHPKAYAVEKTGAKATLLVGSGNLTAGGLYTNVELEVRSEYNLQNPTQRSGFDAFKRIFDYYSTPSPLSRPLTPELLQELRDNREKYLADEDADEEGSSQPGQAEAGVAGNRLFGTQARRPPPLPRRPTTAPRGVRAPVGSSGAQVLVAELPRGGNRWGQAGFDLQTFQNFFQLQANTTHEVILLPVAPDGTVGEPEVRHSVSVKSQNYRIELGLAAGRTYPSRGRPICVFLRIGTRRFRYRLVMPDESDFPGLRSLLAARWTGRTGPMRRIQVSLEELLRSARGFQL